MGRIANGYARISPKLVKMPGSTAATRVHAWIHRKTGGRIGGRMLGADVLTLRTTGRRSGQQRDSPMFYIRDDAQNYVVVPSNAASPQPPAWWLNLQANPDAETHVRGTVQRVHARIADEAETAALWPQLVQMYAGYDYYKSIATRVLPVVILEPR